MAQIGVAPKAVKNLRLKVGTDNYEKHVSSIDWTPKSSTIQWAGGTPDAVFTDTSPEVWTANVTFIQDFETVDSFANFLLDHAGETAVVEYKPDADGDFGISATLTLGSPKIGGKVGTYNESTVAMGSTKPERIAVV